MLNYLEAIGFCYAILSSLPLVAIIDLDSHCVYADYFSNGSYWIRLNVL